jgi:hypothetical protein
MGFLGKDGNWVVGLGVAIFVAIGLWMWCSFYWDFADICPANEQPALCLREWIGASSGYIAAAFAAITIYFVWLQIHQGEEHRRLDSLREACLIADTVLIDLLDTSERVRSASSLLDFDPPMSQISRTLLPQTVKVSPLLAISLQKHCTELVAYEANLRFMDLTLGFPPDDLRKLAFRAYVLSYCFGTASEKIRRSGSAKAPFIHPADIAHFEKVFGVTATERTYLDHLCKSGVPHLRGLHVPP